MKSLKNDAENSPVSNILIVILLAVGLAAFPTEYIAANFGVSETAELYITAAVKFAFCGVMVYLSYSYGFNELLKPKTNKIYLVIPCFFVVINNFPFIAVFTKTAVITAGVADIIGHTLFCCSVALFEEIAFRGIVLPLVYLKMKTKKKAVFFSVLISSLIFGAAHLVNVFGGGGIGSVLIQTCYTFLIGGMCGFALCVTKSVFVPFLLHFLFNFCGTFIDVLGCGEIWNIPTVIIIVILGVIVGVYVLVILLKSKNENFEKPTDKNLGEVYE